MTIQFVVEHAGCASCAALIRDALGPLGEVESVDVDETDDVALVRLAPTRDISSDDIDEMLQLASKDTGHSYRVQPTSFVVQT